MFGWRKQAGAKTKRERDIDRDRQIVRRQGERGREDG